MFSLRFFVAPLVFGMLATSAMGEAHAQESAGTQGGNAPAASTANSGEATEFSAQHFTSNEATGIIIATGKVTITQGNAKLQADRIEYNRKRGTAIATGNVIYTDARGGVHYAKSLTLEENFSRAFASAVKSEIADSSPADGPATNFTAENLTSDDETGIIIATGKVVITRGNARITADKIEYNRNLRSAVATGNVVFTDTDGGVHYTEKLEMEEGFARTFAHAVTSRIADGSWIGAGKIEHTRDEGSVFEDARITPCDCDFRGNEVPFWELRSGNIRHDEKKLTVYHNDVHLRLLSIPVMYFPRLWHPDWTVRRQTGLLTPRISVSSDHGTTYAQPIYLETGETHDLEITPQYLTNNGDSLEMRYRQYWDESTLDGRIITGRLNTFKKTRESVFAIDAAFETVLADTWNTTARLYRTNQDTFLRRYNFDEAEELKSFVASEKVERNRYTLIEAYDFQDLTPRGIPEREPHVLPHFFHEDHLPTTRDNLTLRMRFDAIGLNNDDYTDVRRMASEVYGIEEFTTRYGITSIEARASAQYRDIRTNTGNRGYTGELGQGSFSTGFGWSLPVSARIAGRPAIIEPRLRLASVRATDRTGKVPNRDSSDFRLDEANLFILHREQGSDYTITHSRIDGGFSFSLYDESLLGDVTGFIGSSLRIAGSSPVGLNSVSDDDRFSDVLASISVEPRPWLSLSWAGRFNPRDAFLNESITQVAFRNDDSGTGFYLTYTQLSKAFFEQAGEEKETATINLSQNLPGDWSLHIAQKYDLVNSVRTLEDSSIVFRYGGGRQDCLDIDIGYRRKGITDRDIKPIDEVFVLFNFKHLGSITSSTPASSPSPASPATNTN